MNVVFKVYWNNPIEMTAEAGSQQLAFEVPLGAIISNPSSGGGTASYPSFTGNADKVLTVNATEDDVEWTAAVTQVYVDQEIVDLNATLSTSISSKADVNYVDTQDGVLQDQIDLKADAIAVSQPLDTKADAIAVSQSLDTKADLIGGMVPASQLPSYVDDVLNFPDLVSFPSLGEDGKIYIAEDVNKTYRWGGSSYVEIGGGGVALGETSSTAYRGDNGKIAYDHSLSQGNPHNATTSDINEGNKLYFREDRVRQTVLSNVVFTDKNKVTSADSVEIAVGKLQGQLNGVWVDAATIGYADVLGRVVLDHVNVNKLQFARINDCLWVRGGFYNTLMSANSIVFTITDNNYKVRCLYSVAEAIEKRVIGSFNVLDRFNNISYKIDFYTSRRCVTEAEATACVQTFQLPSTLPQINYGKSLLPTCLGELVIK